MENKRNKLEVKWLDDSVDRETYQRLHTDLNAKITNLNTLIQEIENNANMDINLIEEVLAFTRNIHATYLQAPQFLKRHYLRFFFEKLVVKDRKIVKIAYTPIFSVLQENHAVILRTSQLARWDDFYEKLRENVEYSEVFMQQTQYLLCMNNHC